MEFFTSPRRDFWAVTAPPMMSCRFEMPHPMAAAAANDGDRNATVNEDGSVEFSVAVEGFAPDDIEIKVSDGMLRLKASREEKDAKGNVVSSRRVDKSFSLPPDCDVEAIASKLNQKEGTLKIVAPTKKAMQVEREKKVEDAAKFEVNRGHLEAKTASEATSNPVEPEKQRESRNLELASVPVDGYAPEELSVQVSEDGRAVEISGRQENRDGSGAVVSSKQFSRTFPIPDSVDSESVKSQLSKQGILSVTADKRH